MTAECKDFLSKLLVANPKRRYTIKQIQRHPWYTKDLPPGVIHMNEECLKLRDEPTGSQTDAEIYEIVMQAVGDKRNKFEDNDDYIDDVIVSTATAAPSCLTLTNIAFPIHLGAVRLALCTHTTRLMNEFHPDL